jgi:hypothetical protein
MMKEHHEENRRTWTARALGFPCWYIVPVDAITQMSAFARLYAYEIRYLVCVFRAGLVDMEFEFNSVYQLRLHVL